MSTLSQSKAIKASVLIIVNFGLSQILRLVSNVIITRILVPEYLGLMTLVHTFITGLYLFSDLGLEPAAIRSSRFYDEKFINTTWSIQVIRGIVLYVFCLILATPFSRFYNEPILLKLIPVLGLSTIIQGFNSTSIIIFNKEMLQGKSAIIELMSQIANIIVMIVLAYIYKSIWALVAGSLTFRVVTFALSYLFKTPQKHRFVLDKESYKDLLTFGMWIFISTAMYFLAGQYDKFYIGKVFSFALLGVYGIATMLAEVPKQIIGILNHRILLPLIVDIGHLDNESIKKRIHKPRLLILLLLAFSVAIFTIIGDYLVILLYDIRYREASWMLPVLAVGTWPLILHSTNNSCLFVRGKPHYMAVGNIIKFVYMLILIPVGYKFLGVFGAVLVVAFNDIAVYIVINIGLYKEKMSDIKQDFFATSLLCVLLYLFYQLRLLIGLPPISIF